MENNKTSLLDEVATYYAEKLAEHGDTPRGVDWNGEESQKVRFAQLCKIIESKTPNFSLNDLGCGYGALLDYLRDHGLHIGRSLDVAVAVVGGHPPDRRIAPTVGVRRVLDIGARRAGVHERWSRRLHGRRHLLQTSGVTPWAILHGPAVLAWDL